MHSSRDGFPSPNFWPTLNQSCILVPVYTAKEILNLNGLLNFAPKTIFNADFVGKMPQTYKSLKNFEPKFSFNAGYAGKTVFKPEWFIKL